MFFSVILFSVKRIVSIIVLSALLAHLMGAYVYFVVRQGQIRQEMRRLIGTLPEEGLETFTFTLEEYKRVRVNDFEVKIDGRMYDHGQPEFKGGKVTLYARHDAAEDNLIGFITEILNSTAEDNSPIPSQLLNFFSLAYLSPDPFMLFVPEGKAQSMDCYQANLLAQSFPVESPPPRA